MKYIKSYNRRQILSLFIGIKDDMKIVIGHCTVAEKLVNKKQLTQRQINQLTAILKTLERYGYGDYTRYL